MGSPQRTLSIGTRCASSGDKDISTRVGPGPDVWKSLPRITENNSVPMDLTGHRIHGHSARAYSDHGQAQTVLRTRNVGSGGGGERQSQRMGHHSRMDAAAALRQPPELLGASPPDNHQCL